MQKDIVFVKTNKYWVDDQKPLVTIITSNYNRREVLYRCMKSIEAQTFRDIEYIVVDNGSSVYFDGSITFGMGRDFWHSLPRSISY